MKSTLFCMRQYLAFLLIFMTGCFSSQPPSAGGSTPTVKIGFMPLIYHLTLPVVCELNKKGNLAHFRLELVKYTSWTDMEAALNNNKLDGAIFPPPALLHFKKGEYTCVALGCENGSAIVMGTWSGIEKVGDMKGRVSVIAVPHLYSIQHINLYRFCVQNGVQYGREVKVVAMSPTDMLASLMRHETQGFISGEPYCKMAELKKAGKVIAFSKDIWPSHPGGVLILKDQFIKGHADIVQELVDKVVEAGEYIESYPEQAARMAAPYYGVSEGVIAEVLSQPLDGVSYMDLVPKKKDFDRMLSYGVRMKLFPAETSTEGLIDDRYVRNAYSKMERR